MKNKKLVIILAVVLAALIALFAGVYFATRPEAQKGDKEISVTVVYKDKTEKEFNIDTDAEYLSDALLAEGLIEQEEYDAGTGMYTVIDGVKADYSVDEGWWLIAKNGEDAAVGMDELTIADGDEFTITYKTGW